MRTRLVVPLCVAVLSASALAAQRPPKSRSTLITAEEIERTGLGNAFDAVQRLRPRWLRAREVLSLDSSSPRMAQIRVYIDDRDQGDLEYLKTIPAERILTLEFVSMNEAGARYGPSEGPGIVVTFKH